jgi:cytochrome oxidase Cu insertion factor (SCO1/SenC/PrrC family)
MIHLATMRLSRRPEPRLAVALLAALVAETGAMAQSPARIDVSKLGPQVGERAPDFTLNDQNGKPWTLQSIMGPKGAMLVFYRSADW